MATNIQYFLKRIKSKANKALKNEQAKSVMFNVTIINGNKSKLVFEKIPVKTLNQQVKYIIDIEKPDKVKVDIYNEQGNYIDGNICAIDTEKSTPEPSFQGFGEAEINRIVDIRMAEKQKAAEYNEIKKCCNDLINENDELQAKIETLEATIEELENEIAQKSDFKYYTGLLGDLLEGFGIPKEKLRKPLANLMGVGDESKHQKQIPANTDNSGIVDDETTKPLKSGEAEKRDEVIQLIYDYLNTISNTILSNIFTICSEIEKDNSLAKHLVDCIKNRKETTDGSI